MADKLRWFMETVFGISSWLIFAVHDRMLKGNLGYIICVFFGRIVAHLSDDIFESSSCTSFIELTMSVYNVGSSKLDFFAPL